MQLLLIVLVAVLGLAQARVSSTVTQEVMDHLRSREGFRSRVYLDSLGYPTAGVGHLLKGREKTQYPVGSRVPSTVTDRWLREDSTGAYNAAKRQAAECNKNTQFFVNGLTALNFQLGTYWYRKFPNTYRKMKSQDWVGAARGCAESRWFEQTPVRVLDIQRVLLHMAGQNTDYCSMKDFNREVMVRRGVSFPSRATFDAFEIQGGSSGPATCGSSGTGSVSNPKSFVLL